MTCCEAIIDGYRTVSFYDSLTASDSATLVTTARAVAGGKYEIVSAYIVQDDTAGSTVSLTSNSVSVCPVNPQTGSGTVEDVLIDSQDLTVTASGTGDVSYVVTIRWL